MAKTYPRLYGEGSKGGTKEWEIEVADNGDGTSTQNVEFGATGAKMQHTSKLIKEGKQGRDHFAQACAEARSDWDKKVKKGYRESIAALKGLMDVEVMTTEGASAAKSDTSWIDKPADPNAKVLQISGKPILPMKAQTYNKRKKDIHFPCFGQAKIDGHRAYGTGGKMLSSGGDPVPGYPYMEMVKKEVEILCEHLPENMWYDGELYSTEMPFGRLSSCIRGATLKEKNVELIKVVKYFLFDIFNPSEIGIPNHVRVAYINGALACYPFKHIVPVPVMSLHNETQLMAFHDKCVQDGFEGLIVRNVDAPYMIGHRSKDIQKHKDFLDAEFEIVGYEETMDHGYDEDGNPIEMPVVLWKCKTLEGKEFGVRPIGGIKWKHDLLLDAPNHIGDQLIVRYQNMSEYDVPRFPVGKDFRDIGA